MPAPPTELPPHMRPERSFQGLILALQRYWADWGCVILQPYDMEVGAGTFHPATTLRALGPKSWNVAYVQPSRRPKDGRYGENPNRLQHYYQLQVILKPSPDDLQDLYLKSLYAIGIDQPVGDEFAQILRRSRLHARGNFLGEKFEQELGHQGNVLCVPSHIGFLLERLQAQNQASSSAAGLYSTGVKPEPLWEPSQNGCDFERPQAHHQ